MARKRRKAATEFFEAITAAPLLPRAISFPLATPRVNYDSDAPTQATDTEWLTAHQLAADTRAALHDAWMAARSVGRRIISKPARIMYVVAIVGTVGAGTITAVDLGIQTMKQYGPSLSSPAVIMGMKDTGTTILDRNGVVLYQGYGAVDRKDISLSDMPESLKRATLSAEDPSYYDHDGFSIRGTSRAAYEDIIQNGKVQGGSTITQQLVKNTLLTNEKSFTRKYKEILLSTELERRYSKDQILEMYLNTIYYGEGAYGIEAASQTYFHKPAKDLTLAESALLAGLPQSPSRFNPNVDMKAATERRDYVLDRMLQEGYITASVASATKAQGVTAGSHQVTLKAPHFVFYVLDQLREQYGDDLVERGGITVTTTLDITKQDEAQTIVTNQVNNLIAHHSTNGGLVSVDPHTGDIIAMVGSTNYNAPGFGAVNVTLAQLQPGSSFKPIAYADAFTKGWNGATQVIDQPLHIPDGANGVYSPQNYDLKFRGPVLLRRALANSLNIPAVEVLQYATITDTIAMAHNLGIQAPSLTETNRFGASLVLGGGEVRPLDMAAVYATFANGGKTVTPRAILKVTDRSNKDITKHPVDTSHQALDPKVAYMITNILSDTKARQEEFGVHNPLELSRPAAAKTGTTNDFRDNWTVGYTPDIATAVWVGNNDHSAMVNVDGITGAAPIWHDYMEYASANTPVSDFTIPAGVTFASICSTDGGLAAANDPNAIREVFIDGTQPTLPCGAVHPTAKPASAQSEAPAQAPQVAQTAPAPTEVTGNPGMGSGGGGGTDETPTPITPNNGKDPQPIRRSKNL